jgi:hypothetical protein
MQSRVSPDRRAGAGCPRYPETPFQPSGQNSSFSGWHKAYPGATALPCRLPRHHVSTRGERKFELDGSQPPERWPTTTLRRVAAPRQIP